MRSEITALRPRVPRSSASRESEPSRLTSSRAPRAALTFRPADILHKYIAAYARHGRHGFARCSSSRELSIDNARSNPRSLDGNASGSPSARIATYCAVHLPIPGISHRRRRNSSESTTPSNLIFPLLTARASARIVSARAPVSPTDVSFALARVSADGNSRVSPAGPANGLPNVLAMRPASKVAPFTVTCWPRMARTASSNPFQLPGTRNPGSAWMLAVSAGSVRKRLHDRCPVCVEVKHRANAFDDAEQRSRIGEVDAHQKRVARVIERYRE